jgi:acetolactate synthase-1/3 small subunit
MASINKSLISILALNIKGQLGRMTSCLANNGINILRLVLSAADLDDKIHRTIAYVESTEEGLDQAVAELKKTEYVIRVDSFKLSSDYVEKELCLVKMFSSDPTVPWVMNTVTELEGRVISTKNGITIFQIEGSEASITDFLGQLTSFTKSVEVCRSGIVAASLDKNIIQLKDLENV